MEQVGNSPSDVHEYDDLVRNEIGQEDIPSFNDNYIKQEPKLNKIKISIHFYIVLEEEEFFFVVELLVERTLKIKDLLLQAINQFNENNYTINHDKKTFLLKYSTDPDDINNSEIRECKKSGKPKLDMPPFFGESSVGDTGEEKFSFVTNSKKSLQMINTKKGKEEKKKRKRKRKKKKKERKKRKKKKRFIWIKMQKQRQVALFFSYTV